MGLSSWLFSEGNGWFELLAYFLEDPVGRNVVYDSQLLGRCSPQGAGNLSLGTHNIAVSCSTERDRRREDLLDPKDARL